MAERFMGQRQRVEDLLGALLSTAPVAQIALKPLINKVGKLVMDALGDDTHSMTNQVAALREMIESGIDVEKNFTVNTKLPARIPMYHVFFMAQPGLVSNDELRSFWPYQLLLYTTACSTHSESLGAFLKLSQLQLIEAREKAQTNCFADWDPTNFASRLLEALPRLDLPKSVIRLVNRDLSFGQAKVRLSQQQARFLKGLAEKGADGLTKAEMIAMGIKNPAQVKHDLTAKLRAAGIPIEISGERQGYRLRSPIDL